MMLGFDQRSRPAALAAGKVTNEGTPGAPAQPGKRHEAKGQREALVPSCSPSQGKSDHFVPGFVQCALRARMHRRRVDL
jgi:hypothetical protein